MAVDEVLSGDAPVDKRLRFSGPLLTPPEVSLVWKFVVAVVIRVALGIVDVPLVSNPCQLPVVGVTQTLVLVMVEKSCE